MLELPHALQLISSIGLADFTKHIPEVSGTNTAVNVVYQHEAVRQGIHIHTNIDIKPFPYLKNQFPLWDIQERSLKIFFSENSLQPELEVDFWIKFDSSGEVAMRPGKLMIFDSEFTNESELLELNFIEDQLLKMNQVIYKAFGKNTPEFENDNTVLSLKKYSFIGRQILLIHQQWEIFTNNHFKIPEFLEV